MKLHSYWRSSTSYRVRAALHLKGARHETVPVDLVAGAQASAAYAVLDPGRGAPTLVLEDDPTARAKVLAAAQRIARDVHPANNLRVTGALKARFGASPEQLRDGICHWMRAGFQAAEELLPAGHDFASGKASDWRTSASSHRPVLPIAGASISRHIQRSQGGRPPVWPFRPSPPPTQTNNTVHR